MKMTLNVLAAGLAAAGLFHPAYASAQSIEQFFSGKTITLYIANSVGGGYDLYGRLLSRHMSKYIPGKPAIIPKNMDGGGALRAANYMYEVAPRDGTAIATIGRGTVFAPAIGQRGANFDSTKFNWLGSANDEVSTCAAWYTSGVTNFDDLLVRDLVIGSTVASDDSAQLPKAMNGLLGTKFKIVNGYPGGNEMNLAMERGETQGRCALSWASYKATHQEWITEKKVNLLFQVSLTKHRDLPDLPLVLDLAKTEEQRQILKLFAVRQVMGRPFLAPQEVPRDRVDALRRAFDQALEDPGLIAEAEKAKLEINPVNGARVEAIVKETFSTPPEIMKKAAELAD
jgi:tripartite-type tricarboxylate transporter receptor subunit TctC